MSRRLILLALLLPASGVGCLARIAFVFNLLLLSLYGQARPEDYAVARNNVEAAGVWTSIGPSPIKDNSGGASGRVSTIAVDPSNLSHWLVGAAAGGIWETNDSGSTWNPRTDDQPSLAMGAIAFSKNDPRIVYAGTGDRVTSLGTWPGVGLLKSFDGGTTWTLLARSVFEGSSFTDIIVDPQNTNTLVAATAEARTGIDGDSLLAQPLRGIFKSTDGGVTWSRKGPTSSAAESTDLEADPADFNRLYAGMWTPTPGASDLNGVYRSTDAGENWTRLSGPWSSAQGSLGRVALAIAPSNRNILYVSIANVFNGGLLGLWRTDNARAETSTWTMIPTSAADGTLPGYGYCGNACSFTLEISVDPVDPNIVYASGVTLWKCSNCGVTPVWSDVRTLCHWDLHAKAWAGSRLIVGSDGGVCSSVDGGQSWTIHNAGLAITQFWAGCLHPTDANIALGGTQDNNLVRWTGSSVWQPTLAAGDVGRCVFSSSRPNTDWAVQFVRTVDGGASGQRITGLDFSQGTVITQPIEKCPARDDFITASGYVYRSSNIFTAAAPTWTLNSPPLNGPGSALAFAPSDTECNTYVVGMLFGGLRLSTNGGSTWTDIDAANAVPHRYVTSLAFHPANSNVLYVTLSGLNERTPGQPGHVFKTTNALDKSPRWVDITPPVNLPFNSVVLDRVDPNTVYLGSDSGVWKSNDAGQSWTHMGPETGMPNVPVFDLQINNRTGRLVAFTHGRGAFITTSNLFPAPVITGINPSLGAPGTTVSATITGTGLTGAVDVIFSGTGVTATIGNGGTDTSLPIIITIASTAAGGVRTVTVSAGGTSSPFTGFTVSPPVTSLQFSIANGGGVSTSTSGIGASVTVGYGRIQPDLGSTTPSGIAIFGVTQGGVLVSEAAVPAAPLIQAARIYAEISGRVNTGVAIANPNSQPATMSFYLTDAAGTSLNSGTTTIPANGQIAAFLNENPFFTVSPFNLAEARTFTINSSMPVSIVALRAVTNERQEFLITTVPVTPVNVTVATPLIFAHFADGGGWTTQVILVNPTDDALTGTVQFFSQGSSTAAGQALNITINGTPGTNFNYSVAPRSSFKLVTSGADGSVHVGSVHVAPGNGSRAPSGLSVFAFRNGGVTVSEAAVPALGVGSAFRLYAEASGNFNADEIGSVQTGFAIANSSSNPVTVSVELTTLDGASTGLGGSTSVTGNGQIAMFLNQVDGFRNLPMPFQGLLRISGAGIAVVGLRGRYNQRGDFLITTTSPVDEASPSTNVEFLFPHVADGGGYTTQFILFSGSSGQSSAGVIRFYDQSGQPLPLTLR